MDEIECVFCERIAEHKFTWAGEQVVTFEPLNPVAPGHRLFVPVRHVERADDDRELTGAVFAAAAGWTTTTGTDFNLIVNSGPRAGQTVRHLAVHLLPRVGGDGLVMPWTAQEQGQRITVFHTDDRPPQIRYVPVYPPMRMAR